MSDSRRTFVKTLTVAGVAVVAARKLKGMVVAERRFLTAQNFNAHFAALRGSRQFRTEIAEAKGNLLQFMTAKFSLTADQVKNIQSLPPEDVRALNAALDRAVAENMILELRLAGGTCSRVRTQFTPGKLTIEALPR
jgi:hypothetical protein